MGEGDKVLDRWPEFDSGYGWTTAVRVAFGVRSLDDRRAAEGQGWAVPRSVSPGSWWARLDAATLSSTHFLQRTCLHPDRFTTFLNRTLSVNHEVIMAAVVIPYYQGAMFIERCVESIRNGSPNWEIFIVDNSPEDQRLASSTALALGARLVEARPTIGFGRACNVGALAAMDAGHRELVFLNQDTVVVNNAMDQLRDALLGSNYAMVGPLECELDDNGRCGQVGAFVRQNFLSQNSILSNEYEAAAPGALYEVSMLSGACFCTSSDTIRLLGLFDPLFFMYGEDNDLALRLQAADKRVAMLPGARVAHRHSNATATNTIGRWQLESGTVRILKDRRRSLLGAVGYDVTRKIPRVAKGVWRRDADSVRHLASATVRVYRQLQTIRQARKEQSLWPRMVAAAMIDRCR